MEPIILCGLAIVVFGVWVEFESVITRIARALFGRNSAAGMVQSLTVQRPGYVKYMEGACSRLSS